jgi:hypothetical protein
MHLVNANKLLLWLQAIAKLREGKSQNEQLFVKKDL